MLLKNTIFFGLILTSFTISEEVLADDMAAFDPLTDGDFGGLSLQDDIPVALTAARLKQPRAEVPASITVIEAKQIEAWGVRTIPDLMRFVPGVFVGHGDDQNNRAIAYHASSPNIMRRLQVLVDGRSVFKAGIADVVWDDIPVAMEDIQRVEVVRGPNAASYGANAFLGVINIVTKHPADTQGTNIRFRKGNQGVEDSLVSYSGSVNDDAYRLTLQQNADNGFDGRNSSNGEDDWRDSRRHSFASVYYDHRISDQTQLNWEAAYKYGNTDIRQNDFDVGYPDQMTRQGFVMGKLIHEFSQDHFSHLQAYWQSDRRTQEASSCSSTISFDPVLLAEYRANPEWTKFVALALPSIYADSNSDTQTLAAANSLVGGIATNSLTPEQVEQLIEDNLGETYTLQQSDLDVAAVAFGNAYNGSDFSQLGQLACGANDFNVSEDRYDVEWQDTVQWTPQLRTVSGISYRRDSVDSATYFKGAVHNDTYRVFANGEWRALTHLVFNVGGMYENEDSNASAFSPRLAANLLLTQQQSLRLVYSQAVRSPDLLEKKPNYSVVVRGLTDNYLNLDDGIFFMNQVPGTRDLDHEKITSVELGYYGKLPELNLELDVKVYKDSLSQLISNTIALNSVYIASDTKMDVKGVDWQLNWQFNRNNWLWWSGAYVDANVRLGDTTRLNAKETDRLAKVERRLSAEWSNNVSWHHDGNNWGSTLTYFWHSSYNDFDNTEPYYRRFEANLTKTWSAKGYKPEVGLFWHHLVDDSRLVYPDQVYSVNDIYSFRAGITF
ncbi:TonB-dependent receptor plug domain-containing protein [Thalassolituus sp.]|uniref:TonB-dependent receptor plug domain-containing protein n=1 Tax=Thalassolituus sp. TaxID=2030822 RepID=UPI002A80A17F|nr:TonB-dependent receptor [Thalassolituus sp.]|tara:strand:+ start:3509 stop:5845 length:2337 start_codon:yes stop_codon:yes gene_type:complete